MSFVSFIYGMLGCLTLYHLYTRFVILLKMRHFKARLPQSVDMGEAFLFFLHGLGLTKQARRLREPATGLDTMLARAKRYGSTYMVRALHIGPTVYVTSDFENIRALLATQFHDFGKGPRFREQWLPFLGDGIFNADGPPWKHSRALMRPQFDKQRLADLRNFEDKFKRLTMLIVPGEATDVMDLMYKYTLDIATDHLFRQSAGALDGQDAFGKIITRVQDLQMHRIRSGPLWRFMNHGKYSEAIADLNVYVDRYVQLALAKPTDVHDSNDASFLAALVQDSRDPTFLRDSVVSTLLAGRDTTAVTLGWCLDLLSRHPDVWTRLVGEVHCTVGSANTLPSSVQLKSMTWLQAIISETLRLYPPVAWNIRAALKDTTLPRGGGVDGKSPIVVLKGTQIQYSTLVLHRRQNIPRVHEFVPGRWVEGIEDHDKYVPMPWRCLPFNGGPRMCLGKQFALTEMAYTLTRLAQLFSRVQPVGDPCEETPMRFGILLTPREGVKLRFVR